jgi:methyltransferase (TIGR00027 family)
VIARTPFFDDCLKKTIADGIGQMVVLGAGYDTRAFRFRHLLQAVKVFEVDKPETQAAKVAKARKLTRATPAHVIYVPVDFDTDSLEDQLIARGYDPTVKTMFVWEGVTMYLTAEAVDQTLAFVAGRSGPGSSIVFNYIHKAVTDGADVSDAAAKWRTALQRRGAPARFGIENGQIEEFLAQRGLSVIERADVGTYKASFARANRTRPILSFMPAVHARVGLE